MFSTFVASLSLSTLDNHERPYIFFLLVLGRRYYPALLTYFDDLCYSATLEKCRCLCGFPPGTPVSSGYSGILQHIKNEPVVQVICPYLSIFDGTWSTEHFKGQLSINYKTILIYRERNLTLFLRHREIVSIMFSMSPEGFTSNNSFNHLF